MLIHLFWFTVGLSTLIFGAELLVRYICKIAWKLGISKLIIALTVVAFGTSAPELAVSVHASVDGQTDLSSAISLEATSVIHCSSWGYQHFLFR